LRQPQPKDKARRSRVPMCRRRTTRATLQPNTLIPINIKPLYLPMPAMRAPARVCAASFVARIYCTRHFVRVKRKSILPFDEPFGIR
jgi:hypothetical protein